jgi:hypothetical protein
MAQGCGFPHTQVAKRTAPSRQSLKKRFHGLADQENCTGYETVNFETQDGIRAKMEGVYKRFANSEKYMKCGLN